MLWFSKDRLSDPLTEEMYPREWHRLRPGGGGWAAGAGLGRAVGGLQPHFLPHGKGSKKINARSSPAPPAR